MALHFIYHGRFGHAGKRSYLARDSHISLSSYSGITVLPCSENSVCSYICANICTCPTYHFIEEQENELLLGICVSNFSVVVKRGTWMASTSLWLILSCNVRGSFQAGPENVSCINGCYGILIFDTTITCIYVYLCKIRTCSIRA